MLLRLLAIFAVLWLVVRVVRMVAISQRQHPTGPSPAPLVQDPVCGLYLEPHASRKSLQREGKTYYFCSDLCAEKFLSKQNLLTPGAYDRTHK